MSPSQIPGVVGVYKKPVPHFSVYNYRSERHIRNARQADAYSFFPPCDTDDEFEMEKRFDEKRKQLPNRSKFLEAVRDYMACYTTRSNEVLTYLRDNIPLFSVPVKGGRTYYRGQKINAKTLDAMLNQKMKDPSNEAFTHGLVHGFRKQDNPSPEHPGLPFVYRGREYTHHGVTSISTMYYQGRKAAVMGRPAEILEAQGDIPLLLELETTQEKPFRAVAPKYNFAPLKYLKPNPSSEHEMLLDAYNNKYCLSRVIYDEKNKTWIAKIWANAEPESAAKGPSQTTDRQAQRPGESSSSSHPPSANLHTDAPSSANPFANIQQNKPRLTSVIINPKLKSDQDKLACWDQVYDLLKQCPDYSLTLDSKGRVWLDSKPPKFNLLKTFDSDHNALAGVAGNPDRQIGRFSHRPFVVVKDLRHSDKTPHLLILPAPVRKGNYQDLRQFLQDAPDHQKIALWDTMAALINSTKNMPDTATLFRTNGGQWQTIPYFSVHYMPYAQN
jgi:hypothetical protein